MLNDLIDLSPLNLYVDKFNRVSEYLHELVPQVLSALQLYQYFAPESFDDDVHKCLAMVLAR